MQDTVRAEPEPTRTERAAPASDTDTETARRLRERQHDEFGGINWGSAFFGWLVTVGMAAILIGLLSAAGAAFGLSDVNEAETIGVAGGILLVLVLAGAYYCGGYVSGRMSRFDGARQGIAVWALGLAVKLAPSHVAVNIAQSSAIPLPVAQTGRHAGRRGGHDRLCRAPAGSDRDLRPVMSGLRTARGRTTQRARRNRRALERRESGPRQGGRNRSATPDTRPHRPQRPSYGSALGAASCRP